MEFTTSFGVFSEGEEVVIEKTKLLGEKTAIKGIVIGVKERMGNEYIILEDSETKERFDVCLRAGNVDSISRLSQQQQQQKSSYPVYNRTR